MKSRHRLAAGALNGTGMLPGFVRRPAENSAAGSIARKVDGVKAVKNQITVRPAA